jgi:hypothetical protein
MVARGTALSLGATLSLLGFRPALALNQLPGFGTIRAFYRFASVSQLGLAMLAAPGIAWLWQRRSAGRAAALALVACGVVEGMDAPIPLFEIPRSPASPWADWLRDQEGAVLAQAPFPARTADDFERETWRMFAQIDHHKPLVNGYSSFLPQARGRPGAYATLLSELHERFPTVALVCALSRHGATHVAIDRSWAEPHGEELARLERQAHRVFEDDRMLIYALDSPCPMGMSSDLREQVDQLAP